MQGDWQTVEDARWSPTTIPLALFVRLSPLKWGTDWLAGLLRRTLFEDSA